MLTGIVRFLPRSRKIPECSKFHQAGLNLRATVSFIHCLQMPVELGENTAGPKHVYAYRCGTQSGEGRSRAE